MDFKRIVFPWVNMEEDHKTIIDRFILTSLISLFQKTFSDDEVLIVKSRKTEYASLDAFIRTVLQYIKTEDINFIYITLSINKERPELLFDIKNIHNQEYKIYLDVDYDELFFMNYSKERECFINAIGKTYSESISTDLVSQIKKLLDSKVENKFILDWSR